MQSFTAHPFLKTTFWALEIPFLAQVTLSEKKEVGFKSSSVVAETICRYSSPNVETCQPYSQMEKSSAKAPEAHSDSVLPNDPSSDSRVSFSNRHPGVDTALCRPLLEEQGPKQGRPDTGSVL